MTKAKGESLGDIVHPLKHARLHRSAETVQQGSGVEHPIDRLCVVSIVGILLLAQRLVTLVILSSCVEGRLHTEENALATTRHYILKGNSYLSDRGNRNRNRKL